MCFFSVAIPAVYVAFHTLVAGLISLGWTLVFLSYFNNDWFRFASGLVAYLTLILQIIFLRLHVRFPKTSLLKTPGCGAVLKGVKARQ